MKETEALDMMNSDFKLWEQASDEDLGNGVVAKTITLPWGIGEYTINMEGMNNALKRRAAVEAYGAHIRGVIKERIDDTAIVGRAQAAASRTEQVNSEDSNRVSGIVGVRDEEFPQTHATETTEAHHKDAEEAFNFGDDLTATRAQVSGRIERLTDELAHLCRQLRGIDAALKAMEDE